MDFDTRKKIAASLRLTAAQLSEPPSWLTASLRVPYKLAVKNGFEVSFGSPEDKGYTLIVKAPSKDELYQYYYKIENFAKASLQDETTLVLKATRPEELW
jgi:hypothetical protein